MEDHSTIIGLDLGDRYSNYCVLNGDGEIVEEVRIRTTVQGISKAFSRYQCARIAMEVGTHSPWVSRLVSGMGHEVLVANARKVRLICQSDKKNDSLDAQTLARLARVDWRLLAPIEHRGEQAQLDLAVIRVRDAVVASRTKLINHVRGMVKSFGGRISKCSAEAFCSRALEEMPGELRETLWPVVKTIGDLSRQIRGYDRQIEAMAEQRYPEARVLTQISGVGLLTALAYMLVLEDPHRFKKSRSVGAYLGLRPRMNQSGQSDRQLRITKAGDELLRRFLVGSGQYILGPFGPDCDLRRWGLALAARGGKNAKKRAVVAVARKLSVLLHRLWVTGEVYESFRVAHHEVLMGNLNG
jgi:transposase